MLRHPLASVALVTLWTMAGASASASGGAKNVILLIADGAGHNTFDAARFWEGSPQIYDGADWIYNPVSTYSLRQWAGFIPRLDQDPNVVYDSAKNWDTTPFATDPLEPPDTFAGYAWNNQTAPDSAATATAISTGSKTYNGAINVSGDQGRLTSFAEIMKDRGKSVGAISSVYLSHATPATLGGAYSESRSEYELIANRMLDAGVLDVLMAPGNPGFDDDGVAKDEAGGFYRVGGESTWNQLEAGTHPGGWTLVEDKASIEALTTGETPSRLLVVPEVSATLQAYRTWESDQTIAPPGQDPLISTVPTLETMTKIALNALDNNADGFFLSIEGGAVDWMMHSNLFGRMIEEMGDFNNSVEAVASYLDADTNGNNWENTLVLVTADHDHMLLGPDSDTIPFQPVQDNGAGVLPGFKWQSSWHSNQLVPSYARGPGAEKLTEFADELDFYDDGTNTYGRGLYLDQTEIFEAMYASVTVPEPTSLVSLLISSVGLMISIDIRRRRNPSSAL